MKLSGLGGEQFPVQLVPVPAQTEKLASVFGSVIWIGALRSAPLNMIFEFPVSANNPAGVAIGTKMTKPESSRFTVPHHISPKIRPAKTGQVNSLDGSC